MFFKYVRLAPIFICLVLAGCETDTNSAAKHLLVICIDTVRADTFRELGLRGDDALTPWEKKGVVFERASAPAPWTLPSIASVFTGLWVPQHGAGTFPGMYAHLFKEPPGRIAKDIEVLPQVLKDEKDFDTAIVTASAWTGSRKMSFGLTRGFDKILPFDMPKMEADWRPKVEAWRPLFKEHTDGGRAFHFLHLMEAHNWHMASQEEIDEKLKGVSEEELAIYAELAPGDICEDRERNYCKLFTVYVAAVRELRQGVATILDTLEAENLLQDTTVVLFSDHGEEFQDHALDWRGKDWFEYHGHGMTLYEEQLHVPLVIWSPQLEGATVSAPVSLVDLAPTVARWLGVDFKPDDWPGRYLDDYLASPDPHPDRVLYATAVSRGPQQISARQGLDKSIWHLVSDRTEYFDLLADPLEQQPEGTDALVMLFDGLYTDYMQNAPKVAVEPGVLSDEQVKKLQAIGYLQGLDSEE